MAEEAKTCREEECKRHVVVDDEEEDHAKRILKTLLRKDDSLILRMNRDVDLLCALLGDSACCFSCSPSGVVAGEGDDDGSLSLVSEEEKYGEVSEEGEGEEDERRCGDSKPGISKQKGLVSSPRIKDDRDVRLWEDFAGGYLLIVHVSKKNNRMKTNCRPASGGGGGGGDPEAEAAAGVEAVEIFPSTVAPQPLPTATAAGSGIGVSRRMLAKVLLSVAQLSLGAEQQAATDEEGVYRSLSVLTLASFLADEKVGVEVKRSCARAILIGRRAARKEQQQCSSGFEEGEAEHDDGGDESFVEGIVSNLLVFIMSRKCDEQLLSPSSAPSFQVDRDEEALLWWELRAVYWYTVSKREKYKQEVLRQQTNELAELTSKIISNGAEIIESTLTRSTVVVTSEIDDVGQLIKGHLISSSAAVPVATSTKTTTTTATEIAATTSKDAVEGSEIETHALKYTGAAKRATDSARETVKGALMKLREVSVDGISSVSEKIEREGYAAKIVPDENCRAALTAAGKVGLTTIGAAAVVTDSIFENSCSIIKKTADMSADLTEHKYGKSRGQLVRDTNDTVGNVCRTLKLVNMFEGAALTKRIAKDTGKKHVKAKGGGGGGGSSSGNSTSEISPPTSPTGSCQQNFRKTQLPVIAESNPS